MYTLQISYLVNEVDCRLSKFNIKTPKHSHWMLTPRGCSEQRKSEVLEQNDLLLKVALCGAGYPNYLVQQNVDEKMALKSMCGYSNTNTVEVCVCIQLAELARLCKFYFIVMFI